MKTRFSPSPTGLMHLGNVRVALYNALMAVQNGAPYVLRVEDTDLTRSRREFEEALIEDLRWLGLHWQEGPDVGGSVGPYRQSERRHLYDAYFEQLERAGDAYHCFCSPEALAAERRLQLKQGKPPRYSGRCRALDAETVKQRLDGGDPATLRLHIPDDHEIRFDDLVKGAQCFQGRDIGDLIIRRADGTAAFMFCNAVDDALMGITHVIRGEDHLTNTPRQLVILDRLGLKAPSYGHIALMVGSDGAPFSKRDGSLGVESLRAQGYFPLAIHNYLVRTGHQVSDEHDILDMQSMGAVFKPSGLSRSPSRFDWAQLRFWQKRALSLLDDQQVLDWMASVIDGLLGAIDPLDFVALIRENILFPDEAVAWVQVLKSDELHYGEEAIRMFQAAGGDFFGAVLESCPEQPSADTFKAWVSEIKSLTGQSGKAVFMPLRLALTGRSDGPNLGGLLNLIDPKVIKQRLTSARRLADG